LQVSYLMGSENVTWSYVLTLYNNCNLIIEWVLYLY